MNGNQKHLSAGGEDSMIVGDALLTALDSLRPGEQRQKLVLFSSAYPSIVRAIARQVPQKEILATLAANGIKLHPVRYRELLDSERKQRDGNGDLVCCLGCGSTLDAKVAESMANALSRKSTLKEQA